MGNIFKVIVTLIIVTSCTNLIYQPDKYFWGDPRAHGVDYQEYYVSSFDGTKLLFWDLKSTEPNPDNLILMLHGNAQNMSAHIFNLLWLAKNKSDLITFDYRGYGLSKGTPYPRGVVEDTLVAINTAYAKYKAGKYKKFIIYTQSLGGYLALRALEEFSFRDEIRLVVLDSTFVNVQEVARNKASVFGFLISGEYASKLPLKHMTMPTLVIHNRKDPVVPFLFGEEIFKNIPGNKKEFWELNEGLHGDIFFIDNAKYRQKFLKFIE